MFHDIGVEELLQYKGKEPLALIDVRSPKEFADGSIIGSMNIPLFDDNERAEIGILYKQAGYEKAKEKGLEIVSKKLPEWIKRFSELKRPMAVFCWRGGMRSKTAATLLDLMGMKVFRLTGGYRAYRKWVVERLEHFEFRPTLIAVNGYTGSGKSSILRAMEENGYPVIDLEAAAAHRGSVFGGIGLHPHNQKTFDTILLQRLLEVNDEPYVLIEAESKKIGKCMVPGFLMEAKENGIHVFIDIPCEQRARHIIEEYVPEDYPEQSMQAFERIKSRIHTPIAARIHMNLTEGHYLEAVTDLLTYYYDPKYEHSIEQYWQDHIKISASHWQEAWVKLAEQFDALLEQSTPNTPPSAAIKSRS